MNDIKRECKRYNDNSNWRIIDDETIQYVDENTKMPMPLVCGFDERYFKEDFYEKLINKCKDIPDEQCTSGSDDHFCSLINGKCSFDIENINWYYAFGALKLAVILQQIYIRYLKGQTKDKRFSTFGNRVEALINRANNVFNF